MLAAQANVFFFNSLSSNTDVSLLCPTLPADFHSDVKMILWCWYAIYFPNFQEYIFNPNKIPLAQNIFRNGWYVACIFQTPWFSGSSQNVFLVITEGNSLCAPLSILFSPERSGIAKKLYILQYVPPPRKSVCLPLEMSKGIQLFPIFSKSETNL